MDFVFHLDGIKDENRFHWAGGADRINPSTIFRSYGTGRICRIFCLLFSISGRNSKLQIASRRTGSSLRFDRQGFGDFSSGTSCKYLEDNSILKPFVIFVVFCGANLQNISK